MFDDSNARHCTVDPYSDQDPDRTCIAVASGHGEQRSDWRFFRKYAVDNRRIVARQVVRRWNQEFRFTAILKCRRLSVPTDTWVPPS